MHHKNTMLYCSIDMALQHTYIRDMKDAIATHAKLPIFLLTLFCLAFFTSVVAQASDVSFRWLPNEEPNLAGYKIHYGTTSGS